MRRVIAWLASVYPCSWRERYGNEFTALLDDLDPSPRTALNVFTGALAMQIKTMSYGWIAAFSAVSAVAAFLALYSLIPSHFVSESLLRSSGNVDRQAAADAIYRLSQQVESRANLANIITSQDLYRELRSRKPLDNAVDQMRTDIKIAPVNSSGPELAFKVAFDYSDPDLAQRVSRALLSSLIETTLAEDVTGKLGISVVVLDPPSRPQASSQVLRTASAAALAVGLLAFAFLGLLRRCALAKS